MSTRPERNWAEPQLYLANPVVVATMVTTLGCLAWLIAAPHAADLAAQLSRASFFRMGASVYTTAWFGGTSLPSYSLTVPWAMATFSPQLLGVFATLCAALVGSWLVRKGQRPRAAAAVLALSLVGNLVSGRITFAVGVMWALIALHALTHARGRTSTVVALSAGALATASSPVAGVLLLLVVAAWILSQPERTWWNRGTWLCLATLAPLAALAVIFPGAGFQPFSIATALTAFVVSVIVALIPGSRYVRIGGALSALAIVGCFVFASAIGSNVARLALLFAAPVLIGSAKVRRSVLVLALIPCVAWPTKQVISDLYSTADSSSSALYYAELNTRIGSLQSLASHRIEIVEPRTHRQAYYLLGHAALARGWNRQLDEASNQLFYKPGALTDASYRSWLDSLAVAYVAVPDAPKDFASTSEAQLVSSQPSFLTPIWQGKHWKLFRVENPAQIADGVASVISQTPVGLVLNVVGPGEAFLRLRWSSGLQIRGVEGCLRPAGQWTIARFAGGGIATVAGSWNGLFAQRCKTT